MKTLKILTVIILISTFGFAQTDNDSNANAQICGFDQQLEKVTIEKRIEFEQNISETIQKRHPQIYRFSQHSMSIKSKNKSITHGICHYNNVLWLTYDATSMNVGDSVGTTCIFGGEYITITNMKKDHTYLIYTCNAGSFDTQISIYRSGNAGMPEAYNDDFCGMLSAVIFQPYQTGNYDILVDEYNCANGSNCIDVFAMLIEEPWPVVTIPTVVHVIYKNPNENISDAQAQSQIQVLNNDFTRNNTDFITAPAAFRGASYNTAFQFCLVQRDPDGNPTTGITHTQTTVDFSLDFCDTTLNYCVFMDQYGGKTPWDSCLNIYVFNIGDSTKGIGFIPQVSSGISMPICFIDYDAFGLFGTALSPYDEGRITTHEVGHTLGLYHPWYDDTTPGCKSDSVFDTPPQEVANYGCPAFPVYDNCTTVYPGNMFVNYMDYSDDNCHTMFTMGQAARMDATHFSYYQSVIANTDACSSPSGIWNTTLQTPINIFPNPAKNVFYIEGLTYQEKIIVYDIQMRVVFKTNNHKMIDLTTCTNGVYIAIASNKIFKLVKMDF